MSHPKPQYTHDATELSFSGSCKPPSAAQWDISNICLTEQYSLAESAELDKNSNIGEIQITKRKSKGKGEGKSLHIK